MIIIWVVIAVGIVFGIVVFTGAPYVPTLPKDLRRAFDELYEIRATDVVFDAGSGDGVVLREVARRGGSGVGFELNPILVLTSKFLNVRYKNIRVTLKNMWQTPIPNNTTLVYAFSVSRDMERFAKKLQTEVNRLNRPIKFITYGATIPLMKPDKQVGAHTLYTFTPLHSEKPQV